MVTSERLVPLVVALLWLAAIGCKKSGPQEGRSTSCDEAGLRRAARALESSPPGMRRSGLEDLANACPSLPAVLVSGLMADQGELQADEAAQTYLLRSKDPTWNALFGRTCPRSPEERDAAVAAEDPVSALRRSCQLDRYGLLRPEDAFVRDDMSVFVLYDWLIHGGVDDSLAAEVARPLLSASASPDELEGMCLSRSTGCAPTLASWGLDPPQSSFSNRLSGRPDVFLSHGSVTVEGVEKVQLEAGRATNGGFVRHVSEPLRASLEELVGRGREQAERDGVPWEANLVLAVDGQIPFTTLADTLFTAVKAGFSGFELVVREGRESRIGRQRIFVPIDWFRRERDQRSSQPIVVELVLDGSVRGLVKGRFAMLDTELEACPLPPEPCEHLTAIESWVKDAKALVGDDSRVLVHVGSHVPLDIIIPTLDALRGKACYPDHEVTSGCLFAVPILQTIPPLRFNSDRNANVVLGEASVQRPGRKARGPSDKALLTAFDRARNGIEDCIRKHPEGIANLEDGDSLSILYGPSALDRRRVAGRVWTDGFESGEFEVCILEALDTEPDRRPKPVDFAVAMYAQLVIPVRFVPSPDAGP